METIAYVLVGLAAFVVLFLIGRRLWFAESFEEEEDDDGSDSDADEGLSDSEGPSDSDADEGLSDSEASDSEASEASEASDSEGGESDSDADEGSEAADAPLMAADLATPQILAMPPAAPAPDARAFDDLDLDTEWKWKWQYAADDVDEAKLRKTTWLKPYIDNRDIKPFDLGFDQMKENEDVASGKGKLTDFGAGAGAGAGDLGAMDDMAGAMPPLPPLPPMDGDEALTPMAASPPPTMGSAAGFGSDLE